VKIDPVREFALGKLNKGVEQKGLNDLVAVGGEDMGVAKGTQMLQRRLPVKVFFVPVAEDNDGSRPFCDLGGRFPIACLAMPGGAGNEDEKVTW